MNQIYLDNAATTPVIETVIDAVTDCLRNDFGNPSSMHRLGIRSEKKIKEARKFVGDVIRADPEEIIFTSGGTEANNYAIAGTVFDKQRIGRHCITTSIEHPSVLRTFEHLEKQGFEVTYLPVGRCGIISLDDLRDALRPDTILISMMHVNNEIGSVQPVDKVGGLLGTLKNKPVFHVDAIQSYGKIPLYPREWGIDLVSISGHKIHAPKGIGALYKRKGARLQPILFGGGQQGGLRSGTENLPGIVGIGEAAKWIGQKLQHENTRLYELRQLLVSGIKEAFPGVVINSPDEGFAPHIINIGFPGLRGEVLLHALEDQGVYVSTGSACSSRDKKISHVLKAIGLDDRAAEGSIRLSISYLTTPEEIKAFVPILVQSVEMLEKYIRR